MGELSFVGLGLYDEKDLSLKALEELKSADKIFAEFYTSKLVGTTIEKLESLIGKKIELLNREEVESGEKIIEEAKVKRVVFACAGDTMMATTHLALRLQAIDNKIKTRIIHGCSILSVVPSLLGLQHYKFGKVASLPFPEHVAFPESCYDGIKENKGLGLHTLVILDLKAGKFMTANEALKILLELESRKKQNVVTPETLVCVVARASSEEPLCRAGHVKNLLTENFGQPLHCLVIPGKLHFLEAESLVKIAGAPEEIMGRA
ncbi:MAG: diphthine synthase [Candidatus Thermoplasmatota archaeon]|nr:diphthine synthase [Candidatus Thermoplasmatota archaeon]